MRKRVRERKLFKRGTERISRKTLCENSDEENSDK